MPTGIVPRVYPFPFSSFVFKLIVENAIPLTRPIKRLDGSCLANTVIFVAYSY